MLLRRGRVAPSNIDERLQAPKTVPGVSWINIDRRSDDQPTLAPDGQRCLCVGSITQPVCLKKYHSEDEITRLLLNSTVRMNNLFAFRLGKPESGEDDFQTSKHSQLDSSINLKSIHLQYILIFSKCYCVLLSHIQSINTQRDILFYTQLVLTSMCLLLDRWGPLNTLRVPSTLDELFLQTKKCQSTCSVLIKFSRNHSFLNDKKIHLKHGVLT